MAWRNRRQFEEPSSKISGRHGPKTNGHRTQKPLGLASFDSEHSRQSDMYGMAMSEDMQQILSPSFDSFPDSDINPLRQDMSRGSDHSAFGSSYSADSIIRRVEEEIAAARKSANTAKLRMNDQSGSPSSKIKVEGVSSPLSLNSSHFAGSRKASRDPSPIMSRGNRDPSPSNSNVNGNQLHSSPRHYTPRADHSPHVGYSPRQQSSPKQSPRFMDYTPPHQNRMMFSTSAINLTNTLSPPRLHGSPKATSPNKSQNLVPPEMQALPPSERSNLDWFMKNGSYRKAISREENVSDNLGLNVDRDEKKSAIEPAGNMSGAPIRDHLGAHLANKKGLYDSQGYNLKEITSFDHSVDYEKKSDPNKATLQDEKPVATRPPGTLSPTDTVGGSATGIDSIYFTDEDWQNDSNHEESTQGSLSRSTTPGSQQLSRSLHVARQGDNGGVSLKEYKEGAHRAGPVALTTGNLDDLKDFDKPTPKTRITDGRVYSNNERMTKNQLTSLESLSPQSRQLQSQQNIGESEGKLNEDAEFPLVEKSSTEEAFVDVQHHPVFQKRLPTNDVTAKLASSSTGSPVMDTNYNGVANDDLASRTERIIQNSTEIMQKHLLEYSLPSKDVNGTNLRAPGHSNDIRSSEVRPAAITTKSYEERSEGANGTSAPSSVKTSRSDDPAATDSHGNDWDKASELLYRLKEQRVSFSANFSPSSKGSDGQLSPLSQNPMHDVHLSKYKENEDDLRASPEKDRSIEFLHDEKSNVIVGDGIDDAQHSMEAFHSPQRSPKYFNFTRVKRAKDRARRSNHTSTSTTTIESDTDSQPENRSHVESLTDTYEIDGTKMIEKQNARDLVDIEDLEFNLEKVSVKDQEVEIEVAASSNNSEQVDNRQSPSKNSRLSREKYSDDDIQMRSEYEVPNDSEEISKLKRNDVESGIRKDIQEHVLTETNVVCVDQIDPPTLNEESITIPEKIKDSNPFVELENPTVFQSSHSRVSNLSNNSRDTGVSAKTEANTVIISNTSPKKSEIENYPVKQFRRIRFRNPFPIIKPPAGRRAMEDIVNDHVTGIPDINVTWLKPKKELKQLIVAAMGTSLARRSNACGALKVLTRQPKNQMTLVRTDGFLTAVTFAASQLVSSEESDLAIDARTRAVAILRNVCGPKDNRVLVMRQPGVLESLLHVLDVDDGEGRAIAAATLALIAKTPGCREGIMESEGLLLILSRVLCCTSLDVTGTSPFNDTLDSSGDPDSSIIGGEEHDAVASPSVNKSKKKGMRQPRYDQLRTVESIRSQADERKADFLFDARMNTCALLLHLSKHCPISKHLCNCSSLLDSLISVANEVESPLHSKCLEIICNLSRFPENNLVLTRFNGLVDTLVMSSNSVEPEDRLAALRTLQNMSSDSGCKSILATTQVLTRITSCAMRKSSAEKEVAVATIYNISTEPSAVAAITNTKNVVATLVHLAHSPDSSSDVRLMACEALSTISLWLQTLAGTGKVPDGVALVPLPSQKTSSWQRWD